MWELWPPIMVDALQTWGMQYFENVLVPMDNYISRGTETFLATQQCKEDVLRLASGVLMSPEMQDPECFRAEAPGVRPAKIRRGRVDDMVPTMLVVALTRLEKTSLKYLRDLLIQVVANCLYYDPGLTLGILEKNNQLQPALGTWFAMLGRGRKPARGSTTSASTTRRCAPWGCSCCPRPAIASPRTSGPRSRPRRGRAGRASGRSQGTDRGEEGGGGGV